METTTIHYISALYYTTPLPFTTVHYTSSVYYTILYYITTLRYTSTPSPGKVDRRVYVSCHRYQENIPPINKILRQFLPASLDIIITVTCAPKR